jgi:hypothetical protein
MLVALLASRLTRVVGRRLANPKQREQPARGTAREGLEDGTARGGGREGTRQIVKAVVVHKDGLLNSIWGFLLNPPKRCIRAMADSD